MKLVWRTDVHLSERNPRSRTDNWREAIINKLRQVGEIAREVDASAVLDGGDFFDIKSPSRNSHDLIREVAEVHQDYPCPTYANVGNHDCVYGDYTYLPQQPLGVLFSTGVFNRLYDEHEVTFEKNGVTVRVVGIPYHGTTYDMDRFKNIQKGDEDYLVCIAHVLASKKGGSMFENEDIIKYNDLTDLAPDVWCLDTGTRIRASQRSLMASGLSMLVLCLVVLLFKTTWTENLVLSRLTSLMGSTSYGTTWRFLQLMKSLMSKDEREPRCESL